jgi:hypothetical protein
MTHEIRKDLSGRLGGNLGIVIDIRISQKGSPIMCTFSGRLPQMIPILFISLSELYDRYLVTLL